MLRVPASQIRPGMELARPLLHPHHPATTLLRAGFVIDESTQARLIELGVPELWITFPPLGFVGEHVSPEIYRLRGAAMDLLASTFDRLATGDADIDLHYNDYAGAVRDLSKAIASDRRAAVCLERLASGGAELACHAAETTYLSLLLGMRLDSYIMTQRRRVSPHRAKDLVNLGLGAMLHDIGLVGMEPVGISPDAEERLPRTAQWFTHPLRGYEMVRRDIDPTAAAVVLNHHQYLDGTGYPSWAELASVRDRQPGDENASAYQDQPATPAPAGEQIHVFARIVAVVDTFDRLRLAGGDAGTPLPTVGALHAMLHEPWTDRLDDAVVRALIGAVPAYGPGTIVTLSDGREGAVVAWSPADPCRPTVEVLESDWAERTRRGRDESSVAGERIDLRASASVSIVRAGGEPTGDYNFSIRDSARD